MAWLREMRPRWRAVVGVALAGGALLTSCEAPMGPGRELVPGEIQLFQGQEPILEVEVDGPAIRIRVESYGGGCHSQGSLRVTVDHQDRRVSVAPFDWRTADEVCPHVLLTFHHSRTVHLGSPGFWTVVLTGADAAGHEFSVERVIEVGW